MSGERRAAALPPDRSAVATEAAHPESADLDRRSAAEIVALIARDQRRAATAVEARAGEIGALVDAIVPRVRRGGRLIWVGAGTSGRLGVLDASECPPTFHVDAGVVVGVIAGGDAALRRSSEGLEDDPDGAAEALEAIGVGPDDAVVAIAAGGTTPYALGALRLARARGAVTGLVACSAPAIEADACDHLLLLETGPEVLTGSTRLKAGTATKIALNAVTTALFVRLGKAHGNRMVDLRATNAKLLDRAIRILLEYAPHLDRGAARDRIEAAGGRLRTAIAMERLGIDRLEAEARLEACAGRLRDVIG